MDRYLPALDTRQHLAQGRQVEDVRQALAVGLDQDREAPVPRRDREQVRRALALLPQRGPGSGSPARQQQSPGRVLPEPGSEERRVRDLGDHQVLDLLRVGEQGVLEAVDRRIGLRQADGDAVVGPDGLDLASQPLAQPGLDGQRPCGVDPAAERREEHQPPVAELVAEALDHDPLIGW